MEKSVKAQSSAELFCMRNVSKRIYSENQFYEVGRKGHDPFIFTI
ncbi:hypothetical protein [Lederbergia lenta]|uniref:Uncharacterized protein n=1 Tax=Lederbergia lenta TaxID=1467 RepID=A0A2X4W0M5_LEDLE|nr:hypothetical protein [Lederbergia lenta]MEC2324937.1 hypothetical protein [Lederbergia lenta]SQI56603.1 Uncharacterised protein [Lederbergia lenta]